MWTHPEGTPDREASTTARTIKVMRPEKLETQYGRSGQCRSFPVFLLHSGHGNAAVEDLSTPYKFVETLAAVGLHWRVDKTNTWTSQARPPSRLQTPNAHINFRNPPANGWILSDAQVAIAERLE